MQARRAGMWDLGGTAHNVALLTLVLPGPHQVNHVVVYVEHILACSWGIGAQVVCRWLSICGRAARLPQCRPAAAVPEPLHLKRH